MAVAPAMRIYGLDAICAAAARLSAELNSGGPDEAARFTRRLYERVADKDLIGAPAEQRAGAALALLAFARRRLPQVAKVRLFNPDRQDHGFDSRHSVLQIVNDDMPFLVDSVTHELGRREIAVHLVAHPVLPVRRDLDGDLLAFDVEGTNRESMMHLEIDRQVDQDQLDDLAAALTRVLAEVRVAVEDWRPMRRACLDAIGDLSLGRAADLPEDEEFLRWLEEHHFTFLGHRRYRYVEDASQPSGLRYDIVPGSALGILRRDDVRLFEAGLGSGEAMARFARGPGKVMVVKTDRQSLVHRSGPMDCVIVKTHDSDGRVTGERRFAGLFTSMAYHMLAGDVPSLRGKVDAVLRRSGLDPNSHDGKALQAILDAYPRDELFQIDEDTLYDHALGILQLQERRRVALFVRRDTIGRFVACLVLAPRERFDAALAQRFGEILAQAWNARVVSSAASGNPQQALTQTLYTLKLETPDAPMPDLARLEAELADAATSWNDRFRGALQKVMGEVDGRDAARTLRDLFPASYRDAYEAQIAVADLAPLQAGRSGSPFEVRLQRPMGQPAHRFDLRLFHPVEPIALSDILPPLECLGLRVLSETPFVLGKGEQGVALQVLSVETVDRSPVDLERDGARFTEALGRVWAGAMESDGFNRLVLRAGLTWRQVTVVRAYAKFLRQAGIAFSQDYMERTLIAWPVIAARLVDLFTARFNPGGGIDVGLIETRLTAELEKVTTLDEDRILRRFLNAVKSSLRTNYWLNKDWISIKFDSKALDELPAPRPMVEIFVYSTRMEGVHLRGGKVARGGIRWSDRREDFRTEVLGLMKTQMVKNAVIVPVGSKGGFYVKKPPVGGTREQAQAEGIYCYQTLIRGLLDLTDNYTDQGIAHPKDVVRHDGDDPYLVVAADKGTATFSDIANALSREYGFWLDDAFASGGSAGYDHKKMGITARGAWESVKRHFRELGTDIQTTPFTAVGVGDMSGDVFGNGMLLSKATKLVAAFDHRHIFVDPNPDPETSYAERARLFALPRSSWMDYDKTKLSPGGGVFDRQAKSIALPAEARAALDIGAATVTPIELMRSILKAPADLLYVGGIGTYVKASGESQVEVGDRTNDALRIDASELRVKVIGEGANLALTQKGRIEAALAGRKINTDALDNSAGVDTSDHEVNIKIAVGRVEGRDTLLASMTDEVAALVLRHNYQQSQSVSVSEALAGEEHDRLERFMHSLERDGQLDRAVEALPSSAAMRARGTARQYLTRPELAVLLAYGKLDLSDAILDSDLPDDPLLEAELLRYFPATLAQRFEGQIRNHRLRREIVTLQVVNSLVNRCGPAFVRSVAGRTGAPAAAIARAFAVVRDAWKLRDLWGDIEALDGALEAPAQIAMLVASQRFLRRAVIWTLRRLPQPIDTLAATEALRGAITALGDLPASLIGDAESKALAERATGFEKLGAPPALARRAAALETLAAAGDLMQAARAANVGLGAATQLYFQLGERLSLAPLRAAADRLPRDGQWPAQAANAVQDELANLQADLLASVLRAGGAIEPWGEQRKLALDRVDRLREEMLAASAVDLPMLSVATTELRSLI